MTIAEWLAVLLLIALVCTVAYEMIFTRVNSNQEGEEGEEFEYMNVRCVSLCASHCRIHECPVDVYFSVCESLCVFASIFVCLCRCVCEYIYVYYG